MAFAVIEHEFFDNNEIIIVLFVAMSSSDNILLSCSPFPLFVVIHEN